MNRTTRGFAGILIRFIALIAVAGLVLGCQTPKKSEVPPDAAPSAQGEQAQPKKSDPIGGAIEGTGKFLGDAGTTVLKGGAWAIASTGEVIGGAGTAFDKTVRDFLGVSAEAINTERRIVYAKVENEELAMDVFWPKGDGPFPMVVNVHGGSFYKKDQEKFAEPMCKWLASQGYAVFSISYRLAPEHKFPDAVNDALGAVIFAKTNAARFHGDPTRVAIMGDSAGGNISSMSALCWDNPYFKPSFTGDGKVTAQTQANVFLFGVYDMVAMYNMMGWFVILENPKQIGNWYMGGSPAEMADRYKMASPVTHVRKDMSPTLLVCGGADPLFEQSNLFHRKLDETGIRSGFYISIGDTHGFTALTTKGAADAYNAVNAFLALELKRPGATPATPSKK